MKKILKSLLVVALLLVQLVPMMNVNAIAGTNEVEDGTITIGTPEVGETYEIYKLFDLESYDTEKNAYTYTISTSSEWYTFMSTGAGKDYVTLTDYETGKKIVTWKNGADEVAFARLALTYAEANNSISPLKTQEAKDADNNGVADEVKFTELSLGYYLVDSSLGTLVGLNSTVRDVTINEKNTPPTIDKTVEEKGEYVATSTGKIGDTVNFKVEINAKKGAQNYVLYDKMDEGLTFNTNSIEVKVGDTILTEDTDYTVATEDIGNKTFVVTFTKTYLDSITADTTIVVTYSAVINEKAEINGDGNLNETSLKYGDNTETEKDYTRTYVLDFELLKADGSANELPGAEFRLYDAATDGNEIKVYLTETANVYRVAYTADELTKASAIKAGKVMIEGLDADVIYYLEETKAPEGYNKLTSRVPVQLVSTIGTNNEQTSTVTGTSSNLLTYSANRVTVVNTTGALLPDTGGIGTVLFITIGSLMVLGFGVLLVTKLRLAKEM